MKQSKVINQIQHWGTQYKDEVREKTYFGKSLSTIEKAEEKLHSSDVRSIAYFSMEYGLAPNIYNGFSMVHPIDPSNQCCDHEVFSNMRAMDYFHHIRIERPPDLPIYSGGLGVLAGDTLKSVADLGISLVGIGILWHEGYFSQKFLFHEGQIPLATQWDPYSFPGLVPLKHRVKVHLKTYTITLKLWKYYVYGYNEKHAVPLILLDSNLDENAEEVRELTHRLYKSDNEWWKFLQRTILGLGGTQALDVLGYSIDWYHLNEGHAAFAYVEKACGLNDEEKKNLQKRFGYTCHTPVAAGHDRFSVELAEKILPDEKMEIVRSLGSDPHHPGMINLTRLAMNACDKVNAVSQLHGKVTLLQFPDFKDKLSAVTNGVHHLTWVSEPIASLLDHYQKKIGHWRSNPESLEKVNSLRKNLEFREALWTAHQKNKEELCRSLGSWKMDPNVFTIAWARRVAGYKRPGLLLHHLEKLIDIANSRGPLQILIAGKAHPNDNVGRGIISDILSRIDQLNMKYREVKVIMLENYDTFFGKMLASSVDVWLNNPLPPFEASGTSGMKAILNAVLQLSTLDGWVAEAADHHIGKIFGYRAQDGVIESEHNLRLDEDSEALYEALNEMVVLYYQTNRSGKADIHSEWIDMMISCIERAGFFNTHRMVKEYARNIWSVEV